MPTVIRLSGLWKLNSILVILVMMGMNTLISCSHNKGSESIISMSHVQLVSVSDTIASDALFYEPYDVFIYLPKVGCSSCGSKDIAFWEAFIDKADKDKTALITHLVNNRELKLLERQLGIRVYRLLDYRQPLFGAQTNKDGMIFGLKKEGYATDILQLRYDTEEVRRYLEND